MYSLHTADVEYTLLGLTPGVKQYHFVLSIVIRSITMRHNSIRVVFIYISGFCSIISVINNHMPTQTSVSPYSKKKKIKKKKIGNHSDF